MVDIYNYRMSKTHVTNDFQELYKIAWSEHDSIELALVRYSNVWRQIQLYDQEFIGVDNKIKVLEIGSGPATWLNLPEQAGGNCIDMIGVEPYDLFYQFSKKYIKSIRSKFEELKSEDIEAIKSFNPDIGVCVGTYNKWKLLSLDKHKAFKIIQNHINLLFHFCEVVYVVGYGSGATELRSDSVNMLDFLNKKFPNYNIIESCLEGRPHESVFRVRRA